MKRFVLGLGLLLMSGNVPLFSQLPDAARFNYEEGRENRILLANSTREYPVTPGDVCLLSYVTARGFQSFEFGVRADYTVNLNVFGTLNARGLTFLQMARQVEEKVRGAYVDSRPQCTLKETGIFTVEISGEVKMAERIECWGLTTVSDVLEGRTTPHSSLRNAEVVSGPEGAGAAYDLFAAVRFGRRDQDPFVKPGDRVIVKKARYQVTVGGEVFRPGTYELLPGENLRSLIAQYADGATTLGDLTRVHVSRSLSEEKKRGEARLVDASDAAADFPLAHLDEVTVPSRVENLAVVYVEGAIGGGDPAKAETGAVSGRWEHQLVEGDYLSAVVRDIQKLALPSADLKAAYIVRRGQAEPIPVNLETLLFEYSKEADVTLQPFDRIVIPLRQYFVTVSGAVFLPGKYPYVPNRSFQHYLQLAGGTDPQKNVNDTVTITDVHDVKQSADRPIQPEDRIFAEFNNSAYYLQQWSVIIGTGISVAALVISIIQLAR